MENDIETGLINNKKDSNNLRYYIHFYLGFFNLKNYFTRLSYNNYKLTLMLY